MIARRYPEQPEHDAPRVSSHPHDVAQHAMQQYAQAWEHPLFCIDTAAGRVISQTDDDALCPLPTEILEFLRSLDKPRVHALDSGLLCCAIPCVEADGLATAIVGYFLSGPDLKPVDCIIEAAQQGWSQERLNDWLSKQPTSSQAMLEAKLSIHCAPSDAPPVEASALEEVLRSEIDVLSSQVCGNCREIGLLHSLTQNLQFSQGTDEFVELSLQRLEQLQLGEVQAVWFDGGLGSDQYFCSGSVPIPKVRFVEFITAVKKSVGEQPLVVDDVAGLSVAEQLPGLRNFILSPITEGESRVGWMFVGNSLTQPQFNSLEASLLNSVAAMIGTHSHNQRLHYEHEQMLLGFVRALVSTLDAKDTYTRGHSERVAVIAKRLAEELGLPTDQLRMIYLAGLLHDIGKIGVNDRILQKTGELTEEEVQAVEEHPVIGASILSGLGNLQEIIPGVLHHHEKYAGGGYPHGLVGEEIPLIARVLAVADGLDAMRSNRPYRKGMPLERVESVLREGAGTQWDERIIEAYFSIRDDLTSVFDSMLPAQGEQEGPGVETIQPAHLG